MAPLSKMDINLYELEAFLFVMRDPRFKEDGVGSVLSKQQWSVAKYLKSNKLTTDFDCSL